MSVELQQTPPVSTITLLTADGAAELDDADKLDADIGVAVEFEGEDEDEESDGDEVLVSSRVWTPFH